MNDHPIPEAIIGTVRGKANAAFKESFPDLAATMPPALYALADADRATQVWIYTLWQTAYVKGVSCGLDEADY